MIVLTTLKQKDLAAVSAQQLLSDHNNSPLDIQRFDLYTLSGEFTQHDMAMAVRDSYIFSNPNKHHLILDHSHLLHDQQLFAHVVRQTPLNLTAKVDLLNHRLGSGSVSHVFHSELWAFTHSNEFELNDTDYINTLIMSSSDGIAPFAHPLIHHVTLMRLNDLHQMMGVFTSSNTHDA